MNAYAQMVKRHHSDNKVAIIGRTHGISYEQMANILKLFFEE